MNENERDDEFLPSHMPGSELDQGLTTGFRDDDGTERDVVEALQWAEGVDASSIQVRVFGGTVSLWGDVGSEEERRRVGEVAETAAHGRDVTNRLIVRAKE